MNNRSTDKSTRRCSSRHHHTVPLVEVDLENVSYAPMVSVISSVDKKRKVQQTKTILSNITTKLSPYELTAWMGPSGSGKTSLISVAAGLIESIDENSTIKVNGSAGRIPKRLVGVVWQDDLLLSNLTVEETIYFSARLKTPSHISDEDVMELVDETITDLGLTKVRDSLIGGGKMRGISGGERKRVSVASELVVRPSVLFCDEPTSGLDASSALSLVRTLKKLAKDGGHTIVVVVHQPRTSIFEMFDNLLLLSQGHVIYNGKTCYARSFIERCPSIDPLPKETGIADWLMDIIYDDEQQRQCKNSVDNCNSSISETGEYYISLVEHWKESSSTLQQHEEGENYSEGTNSSDNTNSNDGSDFDKNNRSDVSTRKSLIELNAIRKFETSFWKQLYLLTKRSTKQQRGEKITRVGILITFMYIVFTGWLWFRIPDNTTHIYDRNSILFFMLIAQANGIVVSSMTTFQSECTLLSRERSKKMYGVLPYFIAKTISDMTNNVLLPTLYCAVTYWIANLRPDIVSYLQFLLVMYLTLSTAQSMALLLSVAIPNVQVALMLAPPITLLAMILGGFYIPFGNMNKGISWASWLSFARYGYSALIIIEYSGRNIPCDGDGDEVSISIGEGECPSSGDDVVASLGIDGVAANRWFNIGIVAALQVFFRVAAYGLLRRSK